MENNKSYFSRYYKHLFVKQVMFVMMGIASFVFSGSVLADYKNAIVNSANLPKVEVENNGLNYTGMMGSQKLAANVNLILDAATSVKVPQM